MLTPEDINQLVFELRRQGLLIVPAQQQVVPRGFVVPRSGGVPKNVVRDLIQQAIRKIPAVVTGSIIGFGNNSVAAGTTTRFLDAWYSRNQAQTNGTQNTRITVLQDGVIDQMRVRHGNPNGNDNAIVYTMRVNEVASALTVSLGSNTTAGSDLVNSVDVAAGDTVDTQVTKAAGVGSSPNNITVSYRFTPL